MLRREFLPISHRLYSPTRAHQSFRGRLPKSAAQRFRLSASCFRFASPVWTGHGAPTLPSPTPAPVVMRWAPGAYRPMTSP
eukprot:7008344-Pyramimonas_sp.AAC.1